MFEKAYRCGNCHGNFRIENQSLKCEQGHSFDLAKEGYVNLILPNQKKSLISGDGKEMIQARDNFLNQRFYDFLINEIIVLAKKYLGENSETTYLDLGCGSGFYLNKLSETLNSQLGFGSDVSKEAIKFCAKKYQHLAFSVNNSFNLHFQDDYFDLILSVFSPFSEQEIERILKPNGILIVIRPEENHFKELYDFYKIPSKDKSDPIFSKLQLIDKRSLSQKATLNTDQIQSLIQMTPLFWKIKTSEIPNLPNLTFNFKVLVYRKAI